MIETADIVIIGAGSAGCVLADRLSADGKRSVLVIEAGGSDRSPYIQVPIGYGRVFFDPRVNWMFDSEKVPGLGDRTSYWPRGKVIGGSGSINAMVYVRGQPADFDDWQASGARGWGFADCLPYFKKAERFEGGDDLYRGREGPIHITDLGPFAHPLCQRFLDAGHALGFATTPDFNGPEPEGVGLYQINTDKGLRASTANAYLRPALRRPNLKLLTQARARRILFEDKRAVGVEIERGGRIEQVLARSEVILCAGAVQTPQLLQLSGLGDPRSLQALGLDVVHAAPAVGENLQDHLAVSYFYRSTAATLNDDLGPLAGKMKAGLQYLLGRKGPLSLSVNQAGGFIRSRPGLSRPDLQLYFSPVSYSQTPLAERTLINPDPFSAFLLSFNSCRPTSRGRISLSSPDPLAPPKIEPNYLSTDQDVEDAVRGCHLLRRIAASGPLGAIASSEIAPGGGVQGDEALLADFRARADTVYHPVGTARMGEDASLCVVDSRLRVHGVRGLRIIDASVFPTLPSGNTQAPVIMVAERGADLALEDYAAA